ncbi:MAG: TolC family protein [Bacteroidetes bacterium]|jgi:outer membrane protein TolC|nr:TolC family protein [Bacteroidota bacterium]NBC26770.1 TolC family protein [Bacteroidota bacterium]
METPFIFALSSGLSGKLRRISVMVLFTAFYSTAGSAQESTVLDTYIEIAIQNNRALIEENLDVRQSSLEAERARGRFMPDIHLEATYDLADGGRTIDVPVGDLLNPVHSVVNDVAGENLLPTNLGTIREPILPDGFQQTRLRIMQPLFNTDIYYSYKAQKELLSAREARRQAFINELTKEVKAAWFNYLKTEELMEIHESTRLLLEELLEFNQNLVIYDKATRDRVSSAKFELSELQSRIAETEQNRANALSFFNFLLTRPLDTPVRRDSLPPLQDDAFTLEQLEAAALTNRNELLQVDRGIRANRQLLKLEQGDALPELFAAADLGFQGYGYSFRDHEFWFIRFGLRWDLFKGFQNQKEIQQRRIEIKKLDNRYRQLEDQIRLQVINALSAYRAAQKKLTASESSLNSARDRFQIVRNRYRQGSSLLIEFLDARTSFTNAQLQKTIAEYDLRIAYAELEQAIGRY